MLVPHGVRLNNPLNIRHSKNQWQGASVEQKDQDFVTFDTPVMGIRAAMKILQNYYNKYHLWTPWELISRWAPPSDNNPTDIYAQNVAKMMGIDVNEEINIITDSYKMIRLVQSMMIQENGHPENSPNWIYRDQPFWYPQSIFQGAWETANNGK